MLPLLMSFLLAMAAASTPAEAVVPAPTDGSSHTSAAQDDPEQGPAAEDADAFAVVLEEGKRQYFAGRVSDAYDLLRGLQVRLLLGEQVEKLLAAEAMIWLGEIQYKLGRSTEAREAFRWLLKWDPEYPISPYAHPMEIVGEFELVRREVQDDMEGRPQLLPDRPVRPPPAPGWVWAPLGVPQFAQRRVGAGLAFSSLQLGLGAASLGVAAHIRFINTGFDSENPVPHPLGWDAERVDREVQKRRYLVQWPLTFAFYGAWIASTADARRHWRKSHRSTSLGVGTLPNGGTGVVISGGF